MIRKATLTKKAVPERRLKIDCALSEEMRQRLGPWAVDFLSNIRNVAAAPVVRLSKKQRDKAEEVLAEAFSDEPFVFLEGQYLTDLAKLILHATGDIRASAPGEYVMVKLRRRLDELAVEADGKAAMAVSGRWWRIIEEIRQRTGFCLPRGPIPLDLDGLVENDDADGIPPDRDDTKVANAQTWKSVGVEVDEDC